jgi:hypothetical protein
MNEEFQKTTKGRHCKKLKERIMEEFEEVMTSYKELSLQLAGHCKEVSIIISNITTRSQVLPKKVLTRYTISLKHSEVAFNRQYCS